MFGHYRRTEASRCCSTTAVGPATTGWICAWAGGAETPGPWVRASRCARRPRPRPRNRLEGAL